MKTGLTFAALTALATAEQAGELLDMTGSQAGQACNDYMAVSDSHMLIQTASTYEGLDFNGDSVLDGLPGKCFGAN